MKEKYATWKLHQVRGGRMVRAMRRFDDGSRLVVPMWSGEQVPYEGLWPNDTELPTSPVVLTGVCLFDARWQIEFRKQGKNPPGRKSLALPMEREEAYKRVARGQPVTTIWVPVALGRYHYQLIAWITRKLIAIDPMRILIHLPMDEYHVYIQELEAVLGRELPALHEALEEFTILVRNQILTTFPTTLIDRLTFIRPMQHGATSADESYQLPYLVPERFGVPADYPIIGVEDLPEVRIAYEVQRLIGKTVPVLCGIMDFPSPYFDKEIGDGTAKPLAVG